MAEPTTTIPTSENSWPTWRDALSYRLGYLQATVDHHEAQESRKSSGAMMDLWSHAKEVLHSFVLLRKAWAAWCTISWPFTIGSLATAAARLLGWL